MSACCTTANETAPVSPGACPLCSGRGVRVDPVTLKALLIPEAFRRGIPAAPRFCASPECSIVYFDSETGVTFTETDLSVPVYAKRTRDADVPVCYCFGVSRRAIQEEAEQQGTSSASQRIRAEVTAGRCACEVRNPKGACCLGDVIAAERMLATS